MPKRKRSPNKPTRTPLAFCSIVLGSATLLFHTALLGNANAFAPRIEYQIAREGLSTFVNSGATILFESSRIDDPIILHQNGPSDQEQSDDELHSDHHVASSFLLKDEKFLTEMQENQLGVAKFHENIRWIENRLASKQCGYLWTDIEEVVMSIHSASVGENNLEQIDCLLNLTDMIRLLLDSCDSSAAESIKPSFCTKEILLGCIWHFSETLEARHRGLLESNFIRNNVLHRHEDYENRALPFLKMENALVIPAVQTFESKIQTEARQVLNNVIPAETLATSPIPAMTLFPTSLSDDSLKFDAWTIARCAARMKRVELLSRAIGAESLNHNDADCIRCLLLTVEGFDWRALMIRCIFNLCEIKISNGRSKELIRTAREGLLVFGPLASMLGLHDLKAQIEDNAFRVLYPRQYRAAGAVFGDDIDSIKSVSSFLNHHVQAILHTDKLLQEQVEQLHVSSRVKERYSFWKKLIRNKAKSLSSASIQKAKLGDQTSQLVPWDSSLIDHVPDAVALRVVIRGRSCSLESDAARAAKEKLLCYYVQERLKAKWPVRDPCRTKDYIQSPKANSYQSLHYTSSIDVGGDPLPFEVQVRSHSMHIAAEYGMASHSLYKLPTQGNATFALSQGNAAFQRTFSSMTYGYLDFIEQTRAALSSQTVVFVANPQEHRNEIVTFPSQTCRVEDVITILPGATSTNHSLFVNGKRSKLDASVENGDVLLLMSTDPSRSTCGS